MRFTVIPAVLLIFIVAGCASTSQPQRLATPEDPFAMPIDEFMHEHAILRANLKEGYPRELGESEWAELDRIQAEIKRLVGDASEIDEISLPVRGQLYGLRSSLVKVVVGDIEPQVVCFHQHTTGTRLAGTRRCTTLDEIERRRFEAQSLMRYIESQPQGMDHSGGF